MMFFWCVNLKIGVVEFRTHPQIPSKKVVSKPNQYVIPACSSLSENSDSPLAPKLRFGSALANETPFHILFVAPVNFTPDASTLKRGLFEEIQHWRRSSTASYTLGVIGELEIEDLE